LPTTPKAILFYLSDYPPIATHRSCETSIVYRIFLLIFYTLDTKAYDLQRFSKILVDFYEAEIASSNQHKPLNTMK